MDTKNIKEVSLEVRNSLIEQYGKEKLRILVLPMDELSMESIEVVVKIPDRSTISQVMKFMNENPKKANDILINSCLLTSKEIVNADDGLYFTCATGIAELMPIRQASIKNL